MSQEGGPGMKVISQLRKGEGWELRTSLLGSKGSKPANPARISLGYVACIQGTSLGTKEGQWVGGPLPSS